MSDRRLRTPDRIAAFEVVLKRGAAQLNTLLPAHIPRERFIRTLVKAIRACPKLLDCDPGSLLGAVSEAAALGLEVNDSFGSAYMIPYGQEAKLVIGFKGLIDLAFRKDGITIQTRAVYKGDRFDYAEGDKPFISHKPSEDISQDRSPKNLTHVYLVARNRDDRLICRRVWTAGMVIHHRDNFSEAYRRAQSKGRSDSPWHTHFEAMARKTLVRECVARGELPVSAEIQDLATREYQIETAGATEFVGGTKAIEQAVETVEAEPVVDVIPEQEREPGQEG